MNVHQRIVDSWLNHCKGMFTLGDIPFTSFDLIDLLAVDYHAPDPFAWDIEIRPQIGNMHISDTDMPMTGYRYFRRVLHDDQREKSLRAIIPARVPVRKTFITNRDLLTPYRDDWERRFAADGITVLYLEDITAELRRHVRTLTKIHDDDILQILRFSFPIGQPSPAPSSFPDVQPATPAAINH